MITVDIAEIVAEISHEINKEIALIVNRKGQIVDIAVGDAEKVELPELKNIRESKSRLCGLRCIHTHPNGDATLSKADLTTLEKNRLDVMISIGVSKEAKFSKAKGFNAKFADSVQMAFLSSDIVDKFELSEIMTVYAAEEIDFEEKISEVECDLAQKNSALEVDDKEKALLLSLHTKERSDFELSESISELKELVYTSGAEMLGAVIQKRSRPDSSSYIGSGKAYEVAVLAREKGANLIVIDAELLPRQQKNLEEIIGIKTIDRTELILDIFAQRAQSKEGKIQVELAQLKYLFPRLIGAGLSLSRQGGAGSSGGIATRGPGETKLEIDRRRIRDRINLLEKDVDKIKEQRAYQRRQRENNAIPTATIVGYTNVGKSTLLNALTNSEILAENKLSATLDPTTRKLRVNENLSVLLTDTVGFIQNLPTQLIAAFRATLEETLTADVIIHVVDGSHPACLEHIDTVYSILGDLEAVQKPFITLINKIDKIHDKELLNKIIEKSPNPILISAKEKSGFGDFLVKLEETMAATLELQP
jgi:GTP-binding protein HflX